MLLVSIEFLLQKNILWTFSHPCIRNLAYIHVVYIIWRRPGFGHRRDFGVCSIFDTTSRNWLVRHGAYTLMRCCRSYWPGLCLFCCCQPSCVVSQQSGFGLFFFLKIFLFFPPPPPINCPSLLRQAQEGFAEDKVEEDWRLAARATPDLSTSFGSAPSAIMTSQVRKVLGGDTGGGGCLIGCLLGCLLAPTIPID